MDLDK